MTCDYTKNSECINCGKCCINKLQMTQKELQRIKKYVKKNNIKIITSKFPTTLVYDNTCPFRDSLIKKCLIYSVRPLICQEFKCDCGDKATDKWLKQMKINPTNIFYMRNEFKEVIK